MTGEERGCLLNEADRAAGLLVGSDGDIRHPGRVVDRDVEVVVSDRVAVSRSVAEDPVAAAGRHPAEALDVDVDQLARPLADVADRDSGQAVGMGQAADAVATEDAVHGRAGMAEERTQAMRSDPQPAAHDQDPADLALRQRSRPTVWPG